MLGRAVLVAAVAALAWSAPAFAQLHMSDLTVDAIDSTLGDPNTSHVHLTGTVTRAALSNYQVWIRYSFDVKEACSDGIVHTATMSLVGTDWTHERTNVIGPGRWSADVTFHAGTFTTTSYYPSICQSAYPTAPLDIRTVHLSVYAGPTSPPVTHEGTRLYYGFEIPSGTWRRHLARVARHVH